MVSTTRISVAPHTFCMTTEYQRVAADHQDGAIVAFIGKVRDMNLGDHVNQLTLEHYPGMTERVLENIADQARTRFGVNHITIHHRVGRFTLGEEIVLVIVSATHRQAAFQANEFIMDQLKTTAPFWKREETEAGTRWLTPNHSDHQAQARWEK